MARGGFRGGYGGMNQANMMKQAQKMQQDFLRMQKELEEERVHGEGRRRHGYGRCQRQP